MSIINNQLQLIMSKTYGEEVCQAICNAILTCYDDVNSPTLNREAFNAIISQKIANGDLSDSILDYLGILTEGTSNLVNLLTSKLGLLNASTGEVGENSNYMTTDYIHVTSGTTYYFTNTARRIFYTGSAGSETFSANISSSSSYTPSSDGWIRISFSNSNKDTVKVNAGSNQPYEPGRSGVDYNLRKDVYRKSEVYAKEDVYTKSEIDEMISNVDIGLTRLQKAALIALLD